MKFYKKIRFPSKVDQKTDLEELDSPKMNSGVSILGELVFFPQQMLTSVQPNLLRAIQTLIAPIVTALLAVLVNRDSLVMEEFAKVRMDIILITSMLRTWEKAIIANNQLQLHFVSADVDECSADSNPCDVNAQCINTDGSYSCVCEQGFTGNGTVCNGTDVISISPYIFK